MKINELPDAFKQIDKLCPLNKWQKITNFFKYDIPLWFIINWYRFKDKIRKEK